MQLVSCLEWLQVYRASTEYTFGLVSPSPTLSNTPKLIQYIFSLLQSANIAIETKFIKSINFATSVLFFASAKNLASHKYSLIWYFSDSHLRPQATIQWSRTGYQCRFTGYPVKSTLNVAIDGLNIKINSQYFFVGDICFTVHQ